jgi:hypothetical protein
MTIGFSPATKAATAISSVGAVRVILISSFPSVLN